MNHTQVLDLLNYLPSLECNAFEVHLCRLCSYHSFFEGKESSLVSKAGLELAL